MYITEEITKWQKGIQSQVHYFEWVAIPNILIWILNNNA